MQVKFSGSFEPFWVGLVKSQDPDSERAMEEQIEKYLEDYERLLPICLRFHPDFSFLRFLKRDPILQRQESLSKVDDFLQHMELAPGVRKLSCIAATTVK